MVAVVDVGVAATPLIQDCAKAEGATRKTKRRGTDTTRTLINLHMAQYRNDPQPEEPGGALHPFLKNLSKSCNSIIGRAERYVTRDVLVIGTLNLRIFREWEVRPRSESALRSDSLDWNPPIFPSLIVLRLSAPRDGRDSDQQTDPRYIHHRFIGRLELVQAAGTALTGKTSSQDPSTGQNVQSPDRDS